MEITVASITDDPANMDKIINLQLVLDAEDQHIVLYTAPDPDGDCIRTYTADHERKQLHARATKIGHYLLDFVGIFNHSKEKSTFIERLAAHCREQRQSAIKRITDLETENKKLKTALAGKDGAQ